MPTQIMGITQVQATDRPRLQNLADALVSAKKVVVITGAGISTSCGIPDFRSQEGLYSLIKDAHGQTDSASIGTKGKDLFDSNLWRDEGSTQTFYKFISSLRQKITDEVKKTSLTHKMIAKLKEQRKLVRCYTQNIDGLEAREGLSAELEHGKGSSQRFGRKAMGEVQSEATAAKGGIHHAGCEVVPLHGDLKELRCTICLKNTAWTLERQDLMLTGQAPACPDCEEKDMIRTALGRRGLKVGALRPDIVLYGENHPSTDSIGKITEADLKVKPDLLLVMGTSLKVHGLKTLVREFAKAVHDKRGGKAIFINLTEPAESTWKDVFDEWVEMDCDHWVKDMKKRRPELWMTQTQLDTRITKPGSSIHKSSITKSEHPVEQENMQYLAQTSPLSRSSGTKSLKRTASALELPEPMTPKRRKALQQIMTPPSSRRNHKAKSSQAAVAAMQNTSPPVPMTPESSSVPSIRKSRSDERRQPVVASQDVTPSRRINHRVRAILSRASSSMADMSTNTPKGRCGGEFVIYDDSHTDVTLGAMTVVPDSEDESTAAQSDGPTPSQEHELEVVWPDSTDDSIELIRPTQATVFVKSTQFAEVTRTRSALARSRSTGDILIAEGGRGVIGGKVQTGKRRGPCIAPRRRESSVS